MSSDLDLFGEEVTMIYKLLCYQKRSPFFAAEMNATCPPCVDLVVKIQGFSAQLPDGRGALSAPRDMYWAWRTNAGTLYICDHKALK
jgi:hypothetical protein